MRPFRIVCATGFFDPLHRGHIEYLKNAKLLADKLVVILKTDHQRSEVSRTPFEDRKYILEHLRDVDEVFASIDKTMHVTESLRSIRPNVFAKGTMASVEETKVCTELSIEVVTGVGVELHFQDLLASFR